MVNNTIEQEITVNDNTYDIYNITALETQGIVKISSLPFSIRVLLENVCRHMALGNASEDDIRSVASFADNAGKSLIPFYPGRVLMQDFTGVPAVVDLAAMRDAVSQKGLDPRKINPLVPVDLVIDHSIQVDHYREKDAFKLNAQKEYERNRERYQLLKWAQKSFDNFRVVPPESGICHQVNLEYLAQVVSTKDTPDGRMAFPDTLVGTDSHTTMINAIGVLGWGVGGIEAEAVMLGQPYFMNLPEVIGVNFINQPKSGVTSTDIVLHITQILRQENVVEKIVEYTGDGLKSLSLTDRATIANMSPEYGATSGFFPVDDETVRYMRATNRKQAADLVDAYYKTCGMYNTYDADIQFTRKIDIDLSQVAPSIAGPARPQDRIALTDVKAKAMEHFNLDPDSGKDRKALSDPELTNGSVVIAAITSCTNTSNPSIMMGAGLVAKHAVEKGLKVPGYVKTSLAPGSKVVIDYLESAGLMPHLETLGFNNVGFGCTTCIGNSGPLDPEIETQIKDNDLSVMSVLSGNRNFEARVHQLTQGNYLMSPMLVVAYALAGRIDIDFDSDPLGYTTDSQPVFLRDIWPDADTIKELVSAHVKEDLFLNQYMKIFTGDQLWHDLRVEKSATFDFDPDSQYIRKPPFFDGFSIDLPEFTDINDARPLLFLGDTVTTDHISPAGAIPAEYPAGQYLISHGIAPEHFNSYGSRRGNHEVMMRGTFANIRIQNRLTDKVGGHTRIFPEKEPAFVFDASMTYAPRNTPLLVMGGKEYGTGSSRDWAAKGTQLLGVKAVLTQSFERIHRSNLVGMGVLPLVFEPGQSIDSLGLTGEETFTIEGLDTLTPNALLRVTAVRDDVTIAFNAVLKLNTNIEVEYIQNGGILHYVLRQIISESH